MKIKVELWAFENGKIREVDIPDDGERKECEILNLVYHYGQNDIQPQQMPSVSVADVILYNDNRYVVIGMGFHKMTEDEYQYHIKLPRLDRNLNTYDMEQNV